MEMIHALHSFDALAHPARLAALRLTIRHAPDGLAAGDIADTLAIPPSSLSPHLARLHRAGLLIRTRHGRTLRYRADMARLRALTGWLAQDCCGGSPETCAPLLDALPCP